MPVRTQIVDKRVVRMYNILRGVLVLVTIFVFIFVQRGFVAPIEILVHPNAWMGSSPVGSNTPTYCDNKNIHYYWSDDWVYRNITCRPVSLNGRFIKYLGLGNFFVPTMITEKFFKPCPAERETTAAVKQFNNGSVCRNGYLKQIGDQRHSFVMWAEDSEVSVEIGVSVPGINFDSRESGMRHELLLPNGTILQYEDLDGFAGQILTLPLHKWVSMLGIEKGLDAVNKKIDSKEAVGEARLRMVGVVINFGITVSNLPEFGLPGNIYCRWEIESEFVWSRITNPDQYLPSGIIKSTDLYGVRFRMSARKSEVMMPQLNAAFSGLIELVVLMVGLRIVAHVLALNCYGADSQRWKRAAFNHVENLTDLHEVKALKKTVLQLRRNSTAGLQHIPSEQSLKEVKDGSNPYRVKPGGDQEGESDESGTKKVDMI